jgi:hypothetical protein
MVDSGPNDLHLQSESVEFLSASWRRTFAFLALWEEPRMVVVIVIDSKGSTIVDMQ